MLHAKAEEVPLTHITSPEIRRIIKELSEALRGTSDGIGIAAPQLGYALRMFLASEEALKWEEAKKMEDAERKKKKWEHVVFINPVITKASRKKLDELEGCLSVPGTYGHVPRAEKVTIEAYNEKGEKFMRGATKLYARLMQHEVDHLNGMLFLSKATKLQKISKEERAQQTAS